MVRRLLTAATAFFAFTAIALAADMPVKAPPLPAYIAGKCGLYYGFNAQAGAGVVPGAPPGTNVLGGAIGALVGYGCYAGSVPWFAEAVFDFQNLNAGNAGFGLSGPAHLEQRIGVQTPLLQILPGLLNFSGTQVNTGTPPAVAPLLPPGASLGPMQNYIYGAFNEDDISSNFGLATARAWLFSPEIGTGILDTVKLANGTILVVDAYAGYEMQSSSFCLGGAIACPKLGGRYKTGVSFKY